MTADPVPSGAFVWPTSIFFDDLDPMGMVHNSRYALLIERAEASFNLSQGRRWEMDVAKNPDQFYAIREQSFLFSFPIRGTGDVEVHMWLAAMGGTSLTWEFEIRTAQGVHATARRTLVKLDPVTFAPTPWTNQIRADYATILRPVQADRP